MTKINGTKLVHPIYDELDALVWQFGRARVLQMFEDARPKLSFDITPYIIYGT